MLRVSLVLRLICAAFLAAVVTVGVSFSAQAAKKTKFANGPISVRLCPARCLEVKRHPYKTGQTATVYETQGGWARVSEHIDPARLSAFGGNIPEKPAFWVRTRQLENSKISVAASGAPKQEAKPAETVKKASGAKKKAKPRRLVQRRRVTLPVFRPGTVPQVAALELESPATTLAGETMEKKAETPAIQGTPKTETMDTTAKPTMIKEEESKKHAQSPKVSEPEVQIAKADPLKATRTVTPAVTPTEVKKPEVPEAPKSGAKAKVTYNAPKPEQGEDSPEKSKNPEVKGSQTLTEADKFEVPTTQIENKADRAKPDGQSKPADDSAGAKPVAEPKEDVVAALEPKPETTDINPLVTDERPKKYIKALRDKRLSKLPGSRDKRFKLEEVIALRHYALTLLKNEECKGIVGGGRSVGVTGMLFVVCQNDPTYMRQFPLEEESW